MRRTPPFSSLVIQSEPGRKSCHASPAFDRILDKPMPSQTSTSFRTALVALVLCMIITTTIPLPKANGADNAPTVAGPLTEIERKAFLAELEPLQARLAELRRVPAMSLDRWADAQLFVKAVTWALDFGPINDAKHRQLVQNGLRRSKERVDALAGGQHPWCEKLGRSVRGYVSSIDDSVQPYGLILPAGYDRTKPLRLDVVLHGSTNATGVGELMFVTNFDGGDTGIAGAPEQNFIELHPMGRLGENAYRYEGETDVDEAIEAVCRDYAIDRSRIVLRGSSLGGVGTWQLGLKRPDRYVALGPSAGPVDTIEFANSPWKHFVRLDPLTPWQKTTLHLVDAIDYTANAGMVPVVAAMGDQDPYYSSHTLIEQAFAKEGIPFVGLVDRGAGHGLTPKIMEEQLRLIGEYAAKGRDPFPKQLRFVTWSLKFSRCHWIELLGLEQHYQRAEITARMNDDGSISVAEPQNITKFAIHPPAVTAAAATITVGDVKISLPANPAGTIRSLVIAKHQGTWRYQGVLGETPMIGKRPQLQGPLDDAFSRKFLCVRGTGTPWNPAASAWAEAQLKRFTSEWRRHDHGDLPIKADTEVTEEDVRSSNLILFGDPGSNPWISKVLPHLPIRWTHDTLELGNQIHSASDHGVQLIHPNPLPGAVDRYVVLNSGHTYHDSELRFSYMVFPRLGDWAILKLGDNPTNAPASQVSELVLDSGFFDEDWIISERP